MVRDTHDASPAGLRVRLRTLWVQWCAMQDDLPLLTDPLAVPRATPASPTVPADDVPSCAHGPSSYGGLAPDAAMRHRRVSHPVPKAGPAMRPRSDHRRRWA